MSTRGIIRRNVRHNLGEMREGTWMDETLNYFIEEACDEHSQRAYSNKVVRHASSIKYVQDYAFSPDFGELCSIRYYDEDGGDRELDYVSRAILRNWGYRGTELGRACAFYREQDSFGLFPIPEKSILVACPPEDACRSFAPIITDRTTTPIEMFRNDLSVQIVNDETVENDGLDPACVYIGQIGVYLRRKGRYYPGELTMSLEDTDSGYVHESGPIRAETVNARPEWVVFDFTHNPIEAWTEQVNYILRIFGDALYQDADPEEFGGVGAEVGIDDDENAYIQLHRLRNDIEVEYYRNKCDPLLDDDQKLEIPQRYQHTIVKMVTAKAYGKGNYNLPAAREWKADADEDIKKAKAQAIIPTLGQRSEIRTSGRLLPNIQHKGNGNFSLRFGGIIG